MNTITFPDLKRQMDALDGYTGSRSNDNINLIWADLDKALQGEPYCAAGDCYLWKHAGHPYPAIDHPWGFSYCPDGVIWAKHHGLWDASGAYDPGDTPFYCWDGTGVPEHTGTLVAEQGTNIFDFECNTTPENVQGDQSNGGGCYYRHRPHGPMLLGVLKSSRWLADHPHHLAPPPWRPHRTVNPHHFDARDLPLVYGARGETVAWAQWALGVADDGVYGKQTRTAVLHFKRVHGLPNDPIIGQRCAAALLHRRRP